jgi:hypothetical protein
MKHFGHDTYVSKFKESISQHISHAKHLNMTPIELVMIIGGPEAETESIVSWEDAKYEIATCWLKQISREVT